MSIRLQRKPKVRSGIERVPSGDFPQHRRHVRRHMCIVPGCENLDIQCCHIRLGSHAGMGQKPPDYLTYPGCGSVHHEEQHAIGEAAFEKKYGVNLRQAARQLVMTSPDIACRDAFLEWERGQVRAELVSAGI